MQQTEPRSWRDVLRKIIQDPKERRSLAKALDVDARTLDRWAEGVSNPRSHNLLQLIDALPSYRFILAKLIPEEFPDFTQRREASEVVIEDTIPDIASGLYDRVLQDRTTNIMSPMVQWGICTLILQLFVSQLGSNRSGVAAILAQCMPPSAGEKVRSLREQYQQYGLTWKGATRGRYFLGAESLAGAVVSSCQPEVYNDIKQEHLPLVYQLQEVNAIAAYPIQQAGRVAGCVLTLSTEQNFFTRLRMDLVRKYSNLLSLAFREHEFFPREDIDLQVMPEAAVQLLYLSTFNERVNEELNRAERHHSEMKRPQAEHLVLQQFLEGGSDDHQ